MGVDITEADTMEVDITGEVTHPMVHTDRRMATATDSTHNLCSTHSSSNTGMVLKSGFTCKHI